jgi:hypothetical protein
LLPIAKGPDWLRPPYPYQKLSTQHRASLRHHTVNSPNPVPQAISAAANTALGSSGNAYVVNAQTSLAEVLFITRQGKSGKLGEEVRKGRVQYQ